MAEDKIIICIDMDDTIEDLLHPWLELLNKKYNTNYQESDVQDFTLEKCLTKLTPDQIYGVLYEKELFDKVAPKRDAVEYLKKLNGDERFKIYIATNTHYQLCSYKMENVLFKYFDFLSPNQLICISNKQMLKCDLLIDDHADNLIGGEYDKILIDMPYNRTTPTIDINNANNSIQTPVIIKRAREWKDVYKYIIKKTESNSWTK